MLGLLGVIAAMLAGLSLDGRAASEESDRQADADDMDSVLETAATSTFINPALYAPEAPAEDGSTDTGELPQSNDDPVVADPDLVGEGGAGDDFLRGQAGHDTLSGAAGQDFLSGADGQDELAGGDGADSLWGDLGDDTLAGDEGDDFLAGCEGNDLLSGGTGEDRLLGGTGQDSLSGGAGNDLVDGCEGDDLLVGGDGADEVEGGAGNDTLWGGSEASGDEDVDFLNGGWGDDVLHLGAGDYGNGGQGADNFTLQDFGAGSPVVQITDFDPSEDQLVVMYDAALHPDPQLSVTAGGGAIILMLDGVPVASLTNGATLDLESVQLQAA